MIGSLVGTDRADFASGSPTPEPGPPVPNRPWRGCHADLIRSSDARETAMAIDYRSELRRPLPFSLAVVAAVLLVWLVVASIAGARQRTVRDHHIQDLETRQVALQSDLDQQRAAAGTLDALKSKIASARQQERDATQAGKEAKTKAASLATEQQAAERKAGEAKATAEAEATKLTGLQAQLTQAEQSSRP